MVHFKVQLLPFLSALVVAWALFGCPAVAQSTEAPRPSADAKTQPPAAPSFLGKPLSYWLSQATGTERAESLDRIVDALSQAVGRDDYSTKVAAADALAALGPAALPAAPVLIAQLDHVQPWVREAAAGALASMGKAALPALIDTFKNNAAVRLRVAFLLGAMGSEAKEVTPVLAAAMEQESPVNRARLAGILNQIDPARYAGETSRYTVSERVTLGPASETEFDTTLSLADWPGFHGPRRDSICRERGLLRQWPKEGPKLLWSLKGLGRGLSSVSIAGGRIFTTGDRPVEGGERGAVCHRLRS